MMDNLETKDIQETKASSTLRFGRFLLEMEFITKEQLVEALSRQLFQQTPLGRLAVETQRITMPQLFDILKYQNNESNAGQFGQIAVKLGFLSKTDLEELLWLQTRTRKRVGEILVDLVALTEDQLLRASKKFETLKSAQLEGTREDQGSQTRVPSRV